MWNLKVEVEMSSIDSSNICGREESFECQCPRDLYRRVLRMFLDKRYYEYEDCQASIYTQELDIETINSLDRALRRLFQYLHDYMKTHREYHDIMYVITNPKGDTSSGRIPQR